MTLDEWIPQFFDCYKKGTIKENSLEILRLAVRKIPDELLAMELREILAMHLQRFLNSFAAEASKSYMDKVSTLLKELFTTAQDNGFCDRNPTLHLKNPKIMEKEREAYSLEEERIILQFALGYDNRRTAVAVSTLLTTGLRRGELLALKPEDILPTPKGYVLTVNRAVYLVKNRPVVQERVAKTKNSLRTVPLLPEIAHQLLTLPHTGEYIFSTANGTLLHPRNFSRDYDKFFRALRDAEPEVRRLPMHCCRHTFATQMAAASRDVPCVQALMGHSDIKTTARYFHPEPDALRDDVILMRNALFPPEENHLHR